MCSPERLNQLTSHLEDCGAAALRSLEWRENSQEHCCVQWEVLGVRRPLVRSRTLGAWGEVYYCHVGVNLYANLLGLS